jgi:hypothetical protein
MKEGDSERRGELAKVTQLVSKDAGILIQFCLVPSPFSSAPSKKAELLGAWRDDLTGTCHTVTEKEAGTN